MEHVGRIHHMAHGQIASGFQTVVASEEPSALHSDNARTTSVVEVVASAAGTSTGKGVLIGMVSAFGTAALVGLVLLIIYFFNFTRRGRIILDRLGRPGEFDDEQHFAKEEAEALEEMDDMQRTEYLRAKGISRLPAIDQVIHMLTQRDSIRTSKSPRVRADRHIVITILGNTREGRVSLGI